MIKKLSIKLLPVFVVLFAAGIVFSTSCHRNKDCDLVINVVDDSTNAPIAGATVHMYIPPNAPPGTGSNLTQQEQTGSTDGSGSVSFTFKLPAILQADVNAYTRGSGGALVKLEEGRQVSKTIKVY